MDALVHVLTAPGGWIAIVFIILGIGSGLYLIFDTDYAHDDVRRRR